MTFMHLENTGRTTGNITDCMISTSDHPRQDVIEIASLGIEEYRDALLQMDDAFSIQPCEYEVYHGNRQIGWLSKKYPRNEWELFTYEMTFITAGSLQHCKKFFERLKVINEEERD